MAWNHPVSGLIPQNLSLDQARGAPVISENFLFGEKLLKVCYMKRVHIIRQNNSVQYTLVPVKYHIK